MKNIQNLNSVKFLKTFISTYLWSTDACDEGSLFDEIIVKIEDENEEYYKRLGGNFKLSQFFLVILLTLFD